MGRDSAQPQTVHTGDAAQHSAAAGRLCSHLEARASRTENRQSATQKATPLCLAMASRWPRLLSGSSCVGESCGTGRPAPGRVARRRRIHHSNLMMKTNHRHISNTFTLGCHIYCVNMFAAYCTGILSKLSLSTPSSSI